MLKKLWLVMRRLAESVENSSKLKAFWLQLMSRGWPANDSLFLFIAVTCIEKDLHMPGCCYLYIHCVMRQCSYKNNEHFNVRRMLLAALP